MMFEACIFDFYGTLADIRTDEGRAQAWETMARFYGYYGADYDPAKLRMAYERIVRRLSEGKKSLRTDGHESFPEIRIEDVFRALFEERSVQADAPLVLHAAQFFRALTTEYLRLYEGATDMLQAVRDAGKRCYLLSNAQRAYTAYEMNALGVSGYFDGICISSDYDWKKPDVRFFRALMDKYGICAKKAVMVGNDGICDVAGAKEAGLSTLYVRSNISPDEPMPDADYVLESMDMKKIKSILLTGQKAQLSV